MKTKFLSVSDVKVIINRSALLKEISVDNGNALGDLLEDYLSPKIQKEQDALIHAFDEHPVTKEINSGATASNSSGLLGGYGNLFTFIGFVQGDNPTDPIRRLLQNKISPKVNRKNDKGKYEIRLNIPDKNEIFAATPIPWQSGKSWAKGIEQGISGLGRYLYSDSGFDNSRSNHAIQSTRQSSGVKFKNTRYISELFERFNQSISNIK